KDNPIDVRATSRLNKLYVELLNENPDWAKAERRADMNHFMARLVFCFFAEDTDIFHGDGLFTKTVEQVSERDGSNTDYVLSEIFRAMNIKDVDRASAEPRLPVWANNFPYVNGGLFSGNTEVPRFTRMARTYLLHAGSLNWKKINPDIFGSMIQAVADDEERGALGMHYTSVPNILKLLNPLFLDDLRAQLEAAGDNRTKLLNLRKRMARIRVFDPACGSGNFLVIAYKQMREIEAEINRRRGEANNKSEIPLTNFRGIELRDFPAEIARLALIIAEFQCDVLYRGQQDALAEFLPLDSQNWIVCGNALRLDWLALMDAESTGVKLIADDLFGTPLKQAEIDFANEGGETYICGNPPYLGSTWQSDEQKDDLRALFNHRCSSWKSLDYVAGWFIKAADYGQHAASAAAFVSTNSICQGQQVGILWPLIFATGNEIIFAHTSFKWTNLASNNAGVTVAIVAISNSDQKSRRLFSIFDDGSTAAKDVDHINAYLVPGPNVVVEKATRPLSGQTEMSFGNKPVDGGHLLLAREEVEALGLNPAQREQFIRRIYGSAEFIRGLERYCLWIEDADLIEAQGLNTVAQCIEGVRKMRLSSTKAATVATAATPHRFGEVRQNGTETVIIVPSVSSESRDYLPVGYALPGTIVSNLAFALYDAPLWNMALIASRLHLVWIGTVCGKMKTDFRYSNTLGWNTFPVPRLTEQNKADLTACAEAILLAREAHFPATIADLYDPDSMPDNLRHAHERNDEVLERIYIGRRFKNDTERLEKLFDLYTKMTADTAKAKPATESARRTKA
ncbi:lactate dehydrogenase, partial [Pseudomonas aeruginosa VRFPA01]